MTTPDPSQIVLSYAHAPPAKTTIKAQPYPFFQIRSQLHPASPHFNMLREIAQSMYLLDFHSIVLLSLITSTRTVVRDRNLFLAKITGALPQTISTLGIISFGYYESQIIAKDVDDRFAKVHTRFDAIDKESDRVKVKLSKVEDGLAEVKRDIKECRTVLEDRMDAGFKSLKTPCSQSNLFAKS
ncbi:MAG: hypothetical protein M1827_004694 [Pycnora praestabilis]|nr:MAG: hypothetical protein M1827_004694 [Pycnora praestabilis]